MKIFFILVWECFFLTNCFAFGTGVVPFYQIYVYKNPSTKSPPIKILKRGDKVKILPVHLVNRYEWFRKMKNLDYYQEMLGLNSFGKIKISRNKLLAPPKFVQIVDDQGVVGYVLSKQLFIYYEDYRENRQNESKVSINDDPTDFRPREPLQSDAPFSKFYDVIGLWDAGVHDRYFQTRYFYGWRINKNYSDRIYCGPLIGFSSNPNSAITGAMFLWDLYQRVFTYANKQVVPYGIYTGLSGGIYWGVNTINDLYADFNIFLYWSHYYFKIGPMYSYLNSFQANFALGLKVTL